MTGFRPFIVAALAWLIGGGAVRAGTVELGVRQLAQGASIHADAPLLSWAGLPLGRGLFNAGHLGLSARSAVLMRYDLSGIDPQMKITSARWTIPLGPRAANAATLQVWRLLAPWGPGVCHQYRRTVPEPVSWTRPGAGAAGADRTITPTASVQIHSDAEEIVIDVTRDVELWHSGIQPNFGWLLGLEQDQTTLVLKSPMNLGFDSWILRITFEPR